VTILRQSVAFVLVALLTFPAWGGENNVVGVALSSPGAAVRGASLAVGSTLFSGDDISVASPGDAKIALSGGGQVEVLGGSAAVLSRAQSVVQLVVERGGASFHSERGSPVEALIADATIRSAGGLPAVGIIRLDSPDSAVVVAEKNALEIATAHDSRTLLVPEGSAARVTLVDQVAAQDGGGGQTRSAPAPAGKVPNTLSTKTEVAIVALIVGGGLLATGLILASREPKPVNILNEVSPFGVH
jgi:hypothetical protein